MENWLIDAFLRTALSASFFVCCAALAVREVHMFQLNSYKPAAHMKWLRRTFSDYALRRAPIIPILAAPLFDGWQRIPLDHIFFSAICALLPAALFTVSAYLNLPKPAKKPLVYTNRVKRLFVTYIILTLAALTLSFYLGAAGQCAALAAFALAAPFAILLSNAINSPVEKNINNSYIKDALRIMEDAPRLVVIGVTGSYGKTSVKHFLTKLLSRKYNVLMTPGNYNTTLGVVKTIREDLKPFHEIFVCEMGARSRGDIKEICGIVKPKYGVITSIGPQHLETFGSMENIALTKFELADALPEDGAAFLNFGDEIIREHVKESGPRGAAPRPAGKLSFPGLPRKSLISYGVGDYEAEDVSVSRGGASFSVKLASGETADFSSKLIGAHNVTNILGAIAVADFLGVSADDMKMAVRRLEPVPHRLQLIDRGGLTIIDDAYNSNLRGARGALDALALFDGYKILMTPGFVEMGASEDEYHYKFGAYAASLCDYVILMGARRTKAIREGLSANGCADDKIFTASSLTEAFERVSSLRTEGRRKIVLIENDLPDNY
ncbi:Mur ligase [Synergistales bacterium]|nr:Mur ligase [Synergistales bacterium]